MLIGDSGPELGPARLVGSDRRSTGDSFVGVFALVVLAILGAWLIGSTSVGGQRAVPLRQAEPEWAKRGAGLVAGCGDARVTEHPLPSDVTGEGSFEYLVTLHCGGADGADRVLVFDDWDPRSARYLGSATGDLPVHLQGGGCVHAAGRTVTVIGRVLDDGDVVRETATWNGESFTLERAAAAKPGSGPALPGC